MLQRTVLHVDRPEMYTVRVGAYVARFARIGPEPCSGASTYAVANIYKHGVRMADRTS